MTSTAVALVDMQHTSGAAEPVACVSMRLAGQLFGIPVMNVQDVMREQPIAPIPLASPVIAGSINVRGRIVTAIDMRRRIGLPDAEAGSPAMHVVVEHQGDLYALMVDAVGDVLSLSAEACERVPANIDPAWRALATGVHRLEKELLIHLDVARVIDALA